MLLLLLNQTAEVSPSSLRHLAGEHHGESVSTGHLGDRCPRTHLSDESEEKKKKKKKKRERRGDAAVRSPAFPRAGGKKKIIKNWAVRCSLGDSAWCALVSGGLTFPESQERERKRERERGEEKKAQM